MRFLLVSILLLPLTGCGSPAQPSPMAPPAAVNPATGPLAGFWLGTAQVMTCAGPACVPWITQPEPPGPFSLSVIDEGATVTALLDINVRVHLTVELSGVRQPDGSVRFSGSSRPPPSLSSQTADVTAFEIRDDPASGLSGSFSYTVLWGIGSTQVTGRVLSASRAASFPTDPCDGVAGRGCFDGTWKGYLIVRSLDECGDSCGVAKAGEWIGLRLTLVEANGVLSGTAGVQDAVPVTGQVSGGTALLAGRLPTVPCDYPGFDVTIGCSAAIDDFSISLDRYGRMTGTLRYAREGWSGSSSGSTHYKYAVTGELLDVVRTK